MAEGGGGGGWLGSWLTTAKSKILLKVFDVGMLDNYRKMNQSRPPVPDIVTLLIRLRTRMGNKEELAKLNLCVGMLWGMTRKCEKNLELESSSIQLGRMVDPDIASSDSLIDRCAASAEVLEFMKKDISEFSSAVKTEASTIAEVVKCEASTIAEAVKETLQLDNEESTAGTVKRSVSSFLSQLFEPVTIDDQISPIIIKDSEPVSMTDLQYRHHLLISNPETFTREISETEKAQFDAWFSVVEEDFSDAEALGRQLSSCPALEEKYAQLVPDQVSHSEFWKRYMFRRALMLDEYAEEDRKKAKERQQIESLEWDKEKFAADIELSEEEQIKLLAEYEEEKNLKNQRKMKKELSEGKLKTREHNGLVIVGTETPSQASVSSKESTDGDWEKEFDLEDTEELKKTNA